MERKGQVEIGLMTLLIIGLMVSCAIRKVPTSYDDCVRDCNNVYEGKLMVNTTCTYYVNQSKYPCAKDNETAMTEICFNECKGSYNIN